MKTLLHLTLASLCTLPAWGQGSDHCVSAQPISGTGSFAYATNQGGITAVGPDEGLAGKPGLWAIENDVWFEWVAPKTAVYEFTTCFPLDQWAATMVAIYEGDCPTGTGEAIAGRSGYGCTALFSYFRFGAEAGKTYKIRLGHTAWQNTDDGKFEINEVPPPVILGTAVNPANGRTYHLLDESSWSAAMAAAKLLGGDLVTVNDAAEDAWLNSTFWGMAPGIDGLWLGYTDKGDEGNWSWVSGETPGYENWSPGAPNDGHTYEHYAHLRFDWVDGSWNDLIGFPDWGFFYNQMHGVVEIADVPLTGLPDQLSASAGGTQALTLDAGPDHASELYFLVGSLSGTAPGIPLGSHVLPLNPDTYLSLTLLSPASSPLMSAVGTLDGNGAASASLTIAPGQLVPFVGLTAHHAYATFDLVASEVTMTSNAVPVTLVP